MVNLQYRIFTSEIDIIEWDWNKFQPHLFINNCYNSCKSVFIWVSPFPKKIKVSNTRAFSQLPGSLSFFFVKSDTVSWSDEVMLEIVVVLHAIKGDRRKPASYNGIGFTNYKTNMWILNSKCWVCDL